MTDKHFDPFNDRLARDIRNGLGKALIAQLTELDLAPVRRVAADFTAMALAHHRAYIDDRLRRYETAFDTLRRHGISHPFRQAIVLWNQGLFFEFHDVVEDLWHQAQEGPEKLALQAMIRAAGVYIHLAEGHQEAAHSMAAKAVAGLAAHGAALPVPMDLATLILALKHLQPFPPPLSAGA